MKHRKLVAGSPQPGPALACGPINLALEGGGVLGGIDGQAHSQNETQFVPRETQAVMPKNGTSDD
jgi:hypothetical protein